jgi:hypothetical protein
VIRPQIFPAAMYPRGEPSTQLRFASAPGNTQAIALVRAAVEQLKAALKAGLLAAPRRCAQKNSTRYALARFACSHRALFPLLVLAGVLVLFDVRPPIFFWKAGRVGLLIYKFRVKSAV